MANWLTWSQGQEKPLLRAEGGCSEIRSWPGQASWAKVIHFCHLSAFKWAFLPLRCTGTLNNSLFIWEMNCFRSWNKTDTHPGVRARKDTEDLGATVLAVREKAASERRWWIESNFTGRGVCTGPGRQHGSVLIQWVVFMVLFQWHICQ